MLSGISTPVWWRPLEVRWKRVHGTDFSSHLVLLCIHTATTEVKVLLSPGENLWLPLVEALCFYLCPWEDEGFLFDKAAPTVSSEVRPCLPITLVCSDAEGEQRYYEVAVKADPALSPDQRCCSPAVMVRARGSLEKTKAESCRVWSSRSR